MCIAIGCTVAKNFGNNPAPIVCSAMLDISIAITLLVLGKKFFAEGKIGPVGLKAMYFVSSALLTFYAIQITRIAGKCLWDKCHSSPKSPIL